MRVERDWRPSEHLGLTIGLVLIVAEFVFVILWGGGSVLWVRYTGVALWLTGTLLVIWPIYWFSRHGDIPADGSFVDTQRIVDTGIYALVRHPQYLGWLAVSLGLALYGQGIVLGVTALAACVACIAEFRRADELNLQIFGDDYAEYMRRVPGWNPVAGLRRLYRARNRER